MKHRKFEILFFGHTVGSVVTKKPVPIFMAQAILKCPVISQPAHSQKVSTVQVPCMGAFTSSDPQTEALAVF